jgi:hypothetical protein
MTEYMHATCKVDYAESVSFITPPSCLTFPSQLTLYSCKCGIIACFWANRTLDNSCIIGIIALTIVLMAITGDYYARLQGSKSWHIGAKWHAKSPCQAGNRRVFSVKRVLRPLGHSHGSIRDATSCKGGWLDSRTGNENLWFFTGHILSASGGIRTRRTTCPDAQTTRPPSCAQTHRPDYGLRNIGQSIRQTGQIYQAVPANSRKVWLFSTSPQYRTSYSPSIKKRALKIRHDYCGQSGKLLGRYEAMRRQAISGYGTNWGFSLCIYKGLAAWIDVWISETEHICSMPPSNISESKQPLPNIGQQFAMLITNVLIDAGKGVLL